MRFSMLRITGGNPVLSGAEEGRKLLAALIAQVQPTAEPTTAFLDFFQVAVVTASFLRESVLKFRDYARSATNVYPVIANVSATVLEELEYFLKSCGEAIWVCELDDQDRPLNARIIGALDQTEKDTFEMVSRLGRATAPELAAAAPNAGIKSTAWNNRLASLADKGLLFQGRVGKTKFFTPVLEMS